VTLPHEPLRRCDLHLHTRYSAWKRLKIIRARDSYSDPVEVFDRARAAGMDFVAITDHESIEGALRLLDARPGNAAEIIIGEEVETRFPDTGQWIHVNVFGLDEATHAEVQRLRPNVYDLVACLRGRGLLHVLNHPFQSYRFQKSPRAYVEEILALFDHFEVGNGTMPCNHAAAADAMLRFAGALLQRKTAVAGSDAHVPEHAGSSFTAAPGRTAREWLASVARGECSYTTSAIGFVGLLLNIYRAIGSYYGEVLTPRGRHGMTAANYLAATGLLPAVVLGLPAALALANDIRQRCIARWTRRSLERATAEVSRAVSPGASPIPRDRPGILEFLD
jgi:predicted metal-dependent phosphoesterase TrpH